MGGGVGFEIVVVNVNDFVRVPGGVSICSESGECMRHNVVYMEICYWKCR